MRLNKSIKELIVENIIERKINKPREKLRDEFEKYVSKLIEGKGIKREPSVKKWIESEPHDDCLTTTSWVRIHHGDKRIDNLNLHLGIHSYRGFKLKKSIKITAEESRNALRIQLSKSELNKIVKLSEKLDKLDGLEKKMKESFWGALNSVTTINKLKESYPDLYKEIPKENLTQSTALTIPSHVISELVK